jgi:hypothetical protein
MGIPYLHDGDLMNVLICTKALPATALPMRAINVGSSNGSADPKLFEAEVSVRKYNAMSYCWGPGQVLLIYNHPREETATRISSQTLSHNLRCTCLLKVISSPYME